MGSANGYMGITAHLLYTVTSLLVLGALWAFTAANGKLYGRAHRWFIGGGFAVAAFLGYLMIAVLFVNVDAPGSGQDGGFPLWHIAVALGAAVLAGVLGLLCSRLLPAVEDPATRIRRAGRGSRSPTAKWPAGHAGSACGGRRSPCWCSWRPVSPSAWG